MQAVAHSEHNMANGLMEKDGWWDRQKVAQANKFGITKDPREMGWWELQKAAQAKKMGLTDAYEKQERDRAAREKVIGLVGQAQSGYKMSPEELFPDENQAEAISSGLPVGTTYPEQVAATQGLMTKGSGYLGSIEDPRQLEQAKLYGGLMSTPGYEQIGAQGLQGITSQQGLMARQAATKQPMVGQFKDMNEYLKAKQGLRKEFTPQLAPSRESIRKFNQATDIVTKRKGYTRMTGADDTVLIKAFASMILPGEAVMEGDIATIVNQSGLPGTIQSYLQAFKGAGQLGIEQRQQIYDAMRGLADRAGRENSEIRNQLGTDIKEGGFTPEGFFRPKLSYKPYTAKAPPPPAGFK